MNLAKEHRAVQPLLGVYAVDALDDEERTLVEHHLRTCAECRAETEEHRQTLSELGESEVPPKGLQEKIESSLEEAPPRLDLASLRAPRGQRRIRTLAAVAAAALLVGVLGVRVVQQESRLAVLEQDVGKDGLLRAAAVAAADPNAERITLRSADENLVVDAVFLPDGRGFLVSNNLPSLPEDRVYQLWALVDETRISLGVMEASSQVVAFRGPRSADGLAITEEPSGGVPSTTKAPIVVGLRRA